MKHTYYKSTTSSSPLSAAVKAGETLYLSGQLGISPETGKIVSHDAGEQTVQVLKNMEDVLTQAGYSFAGCQQCLLLCLGRGQASQIRCPGGLPQSGSESGDRGHRSEADG